MTNGTNEFMKKRLSKSKLTIVFASHVAVNAEFFIEEKIGEIWDKSEMDLRKELDKEGYDKDWIEKEMTELKIPRKLFGDLRVLWDEELTKFVHKLEYLPGLKQIEEREQKNIQDLEQRVEKILSLLRKYEI